jgi:geranylgeranylglycerol-phosphate geranylgeranyltransferase
MNSDRLRGLIQLSRPVNVAITLAVIPSAVVLIGGKGISMVEALFAGLTGALVTAGANAINDFFDLEIDRINRPDRPLPRGVITKRNAVMMWLLTSLAAIFLNLVLPLAALIVVVLSIILLFIYSAALKRTVLAGNIVVAGMTGMAFLYAAIVAERPLRGLMPAGFAFLANFSREIIKDIEDMEGDRQLGAVTLPIVYGVRTSLLVVSISLWSLIALTILAYAAGMYSRSFLIIVSLVDAALAYTALNIWNAPTQDAMRAHSVRLKLCMVGGLAAIIAGSW